MSTVYVVAQFVGESVSKTTLELATCGARVGSVTAIVFAGSGKGSALAVVLFLLVTPILIYNIRSLRKERANT